MDRVVIVTGAGAGLGRSLARALVGAGDRVVAIGRDAVALAETGHGLDAARYEGLVVDVADHAALESAIAAVAASHGRIDALFANAAIYPRVMIADQDPAGFMAAMAVNVGGVVAACRAVLPAMMRRAHGRIVILGSFAHHAPIAEAAAYSASKGAVHALAKAVAVEVGADYPDILVNEWVPGALNTAMGLPDGIDPEIAARWGVALLDLPPGGPSGQLFFMDKLHLPPASLKQRIKRKLGLA